MGRLKRTILLSFRAKVLVPVIAVMVLLVAVTVWVVNLRITQQVEADARKSLNAAATRFNHSRILRSQYQISVFHSVLNQSSHTSAFQKRDPSTIQDQLARILGELSIESVDTVMFTIVEDFAPANKDLLLQKRDPVLSASEFAKASDSAVGRALRGEETADTICVGEKLYDVLSIPVYGVGHELIGVMTYGKDLDWKVAQEFSVNTDGPIVLFAGGHPVASTMPTMETGNQLSDLFKQLSSQGGQTNATFGVQKAIFDNERYFCSGGRFPSLNGDASVGYLLLYSYEPPLRALHATQQQLLIVSLVAILFSSVVVWYLVRKVTQPLKELRDSAEAVGRGDFSQRVNVGSLDECGELAFVFNHMTESLQSSHADLKKTVETLKSTQSQLVQSEKLAGIGEFVAGVAHELNNPLTSVMGFSELLKMSDEDPQRKRHLEMIHKSAMRCQKIVQNLLSFARHHQPERKLVCVNSLIEGAVEILQYQLRTNNIQVVTGLDPDLPQAMVDPHQMQQVFINILNNGRQAIEEFRPKGMIKIRTEVSGVNVRVTFSDDGPGIAEENVSKIFDPFFTTKVTGKGTGLGLSLCYGIVKEHNGSIQVLSKYGEGATFVIDLPIAADTDKTTRDKSNTSTLVKANTREGAGKKVLVIDDEEAILQMVSEALGRSGYEVDVAADGETALRHMRQRNYDLALCDWKMPGLNGEQIYRRLRSTNPAMSDRMIFITGDVVNDHAQEFLMEHRKVCLNKPFSLSEFRTAITTALNGRG